MGAMTGLLAGLATVGGAIALGRLVARKTPVLKRTLDTARRTVDAVMDNREDPSAAGAANGADHGAVHGAVIDYERDPSSGIFRAKD